MKEDLRENLIHCGRGWAAAEPTVFENHQKCRILGFQKIAIFDHFWHFQLAFVQCKRSSLRSQC